MIKPGPWIYAVPATIVAGVAFSMLQGEGYGGMPVYVTTAICLALALPYFYLGAPWYADRLRGFAGRFSNAGMVASLYLFGLYLTYAYFTNSFTWDGAARLFMYLTVPVYFATFARQGGRLAPLWGLLCMLALWLPFDFGLLNNIWAWPDRNAAYVLNTLVAVDLGLLLFLIYLGESDVGYEYALTMEELKIAGLYAAVYAAIAIPFGLYSGFLEWSPKAEFFSFFTSAAGIFIFIALPEELLFRGLLQNMLTSICKNAYIALGITAVIFGASHLNNGPTAPDMRYFALASVAALFYGHAYIRTKRLMAPALIHVLIDAVWLHFFKG